jgi:uncharacterized membrane protein required for colicin V production
MVPLHTVFGALLILFGLIGGLRGWAKELIVAFSVFLALFVQHVLLSFIPPLRALFENMAPQSQFYTRAIVFIIITVFGYASPTVVSKIGARVARERLQDILLGFFIGLLNGFLIVGTVVAFLDMSYYGVPEDMRGTQQKVDDSGNPVLDKEGNPVLEVVYFPGAKGIGGIAPPEPGSTSANLLAFLPPRVIERSDAILYLAVAAAFVFVVVVFL